MAYPAPPSSAVVPTTNNVHHPYPPTQATVQLDDLDTSTRRTSWRYGRIFPQNFFYNAFFPRTMTPAQLIVEQYRQQHRVREQQERSTLRLRLERIGRANRQTDSSIDSYSRGNTPRTNEGNPPTLPPKDYPRVQSPILEVSDNALPDQVYSGPSKLYSDSLVAQNGDAQPESEVETECGPKIRLTSARGECLAIAREEATQMMYAAGTQFNIPCTRYGCTDTLPNLDALVSHIDIHNMGIPGVPSYVCLTCRACFTTLEDKVIHRRGCGLRDSSHMSPPPSPGGLLNRFTAKFGQAFWNP